HLEVEAGSLDWKKLLAGTAGRLSFGAGSWNYSLNGSWVDSGGVNRWEFYRNGTLVARTQYTRGDIAVGASLYGTDNEFQNADLLESLSPDAIESIPGAAVGKYFGVQIPDPSDV